MSIDHATTAGFTSIARSPASAAHSVRRMTLAGMALLAVLATGSLLSGGAEGYAVAGCSVEPVQPRHGVASEATMQVARGGSCAIWLRPGNIAIDELAVVQPPANGMLRMRGRTGVYYQPDKAFKGDDSFTFELTGHVGAERKTTTVRVRVNVR